MKDWFKPTLGPDEEWPTYTPPAPIKLNVILATTLMALSLIGIVFVLGGEPSFEVVRINTERVQGN